MYETDESSVSRAAMKKLSLDVKSIKYRLSKIEDEVATLHELVQMQNDVGRRDSNSVSSSPKRLDFANVQDENDLRWRLELPRSNYNKSDTNPADVAMMINNQAWYGDVFLFEVICQYRGYRPKENNWFNSVFPFYTLSGFSKYIFSQKWFHHTCILSIGYSDLFKFNSFSDKRMRWMLHQMLNHMRDNGAERVKVLSLPPARQMMKNAEYLRLCQTNNRVLLSITETHPGVDFVNLDSFFLKNSDESFTYFENERITVDILDNLLMKKEDDKFFIYVEPELSKCIIDFIIDFRYTSTELPYINRKLKGCDTRNDDYSEYRDRADHYNEKPRLSYKRRRESRSHEREKSSPLHVLERIGPTVSRVSPNRNKDHRSSFAPFISNRSDRSPRRRENRFSYPESSGIAIDERENSSRYDKRMYESSFNSEEPPENNDPLYYKESRGRSRNNDGLPYEERIVSKSLTEVRLVRYGERKSVSPPPWLKNNSLVSTSSRSTK